MTAFNVEDSGYLDVKLITLPVLLTLGLAGLLLWSPPVLAASFKSITSMNNIFASLSQHETTIVRLIVATAYVMGIFYMASALFELKKVGRNMGMAGPNNSMSSAIYRMLFGVLLVYLPSTVRVGIATVWNDSTILTYSNSSSDIFAGIKSGIITLMRVVGYVSLIRGITAMNRAASGTNNAQQGGMGKALLNVVGGILAINVVGTINIIGSVLGLDLI